MYHFKSLVILSFFALLAGCASNSDSSGDSGSQNATGLQEAVEFSMPEIEHVVIIGVDGMGGLFVGGPETPTLDAMMLEGAFTLTMQNTLPTSSSTNWMSMVNGQGTDGHGVYSNGWSVGDSQPAPTIVKLLREQRPDATIGVFYDWGDFGRLVEDGFADEKTDPGAEDETTAAAIDFIKNNQPTLTFIHLDHVDLAGHATGWTKTPGDCVRSDGCPYLASIEKADQLIAEILAAIDDAGMGENTAVIISSDHGGIFTGHGGDTYDERCIPFIMTGPGVLPGQIMRVPRIYDIPATAAALLGLELPESWVGRPVLDGFADYRLPTPSSTSIEHQEITEYTKLYDDAGSGAASDLSIWRPVVPDGFYWLGDVVMVDSSEAPTFPTPVVRGDETMLAEPLGYELLWQDEGSGSDREDAGTGISLWHGIAPAGYTCVGAVAMEGYDVAPATSLTRCIHDDFLVAGERELVWSDAGTGSVLDSSIWSCTADTEDSLSTNTFISRRSQFDAGMDLCRSLERSRLH